MNEFKNERTLIMGILAIFIMSLCMQPSFAQNSEPKADKLLYSDNFTARKESGWPIYSDSNYTKYYKDGKFKEIQGLFHQWGLDLAENSETMASYTVAIIEDNSGNIRLCNPETVVFIEEEK